MTQQYDVEQRPTPAETRAGWTWLAGVWAVVAVFGVVTLVRSAQVGIGLRDPHGEIFVSRITLSAGIFVGLVLVDAVLRSRRARPHGWSWRHVSGVIRGRWTPRRLALTWSGLLAYHVTYFCYHNLKSWDVLNTPQDKALDRWDRALFLGHSPAVLLHDLLGQGASAWVLMFFYESFSTIVCISFVAALVFTDRFRDGMVFIASAIWVWILGVASYYLIPSLGPFHVAPQDFAGLPHMMIQDTQARYMGQRAFLLAHPDNPHAFAQISAFASLHVGVTTVITLMLRYYRQRRLYLAMCVFLAITVVATVYLGWHYALDDVAGLFIGWLAVRLGIRMVAPRPR